VGDLSKSRTLSRSQVGRVLLDCGFLIKAAFRTPPNSQELRSMFNIDIGSTREDPYTPDVNADIFPSSIREWKNSKTVLFWILGSHFWWDFNQSLNLAQQPSYCLFVEHLLPDKMRSATSSVLSFLRTLKRSELLSDVLMKDQHLGPTSVLLAVPEGRTGSGLYILSHYFPKDG